MVSNNVELPHWKGMIQIFQPYVWYATLVSCATLPFILWTMMTKVVARETRTDFGYMLLIVIGFLVANSPSITPKVYRMRRILLVWTLFCVCWIAAYSSSLISMITRPMHVITVMLQIIIIGNNFNSGVYAIHVG